MFDFIALLIFIGSWVGYSYWAHQQSSSLSLTKILADFRQDWMLRILKREQRNADMAAMTQLERNASIYAGIALMAIVTIFIALSLSEETISLLMGSSLIEQSSLTVIKFKLAVIGLVFMYCFFTFSWCMRQFGFCALLVGAAPMPTEGINADVKRHFATHAGNILDLASRQFNLGLRGFNFSLAALSWLMGSLWFIAITLVVVAVLYRREYESNTLKELIRARGLDPDQIDKKD